MFTSDTNLCFNDLLICTEYSQLASYNDYALIEVSLHYLPFQYYKYLHFIFEPLKSIDENIKILIIFTSISKSSVLSERFFSGNVLTIYKLTRIQNDARLFPHAANVSFSLLYVQIICQPTVNPNASSYFFVANFVPAIIQLYFHECFRLYLHTRIAIIRRLRGRLKFNGIFFWMHIASICLRISLLAED